MTTSRWGCGELHLSILQAIVAVRWRVKICRECYSDQVGLQPGGFTVKCIHIICLVVVLASVSTCLATCPAPHEQCPLDLGELGLFFDPEGTQSCRPVALGETLEIYVVTRTPAGGISGFGLGSLSMEGNSLVSTEAATIAPGFRHLSLTDGCDEGEAVDAEGCPLAEAEVVALGAFTVTRLEEDQVCIGSFCADTIAGPSPPGSYLPWYLPCGTNPVPVEFVLGAWSCLSLSGFPVRIESPGSWSTIKADFGR
jgi:hypothetical protein